MNGILIVMPNKSERQVMVAYMEKVRGFVVTSTSDGLAALKLCEENNKFGVLLIDCELPHLSGVGVIAQVKEKWPNIKTILMGHSEYTDSQKKRIGADRYVDKGRLDHQVLKVMIMGLLKGGLNE